MNPRNMSSRSPSGGYLGMPIEREVHLGRDALELHAPHRLDQVVGQLARVDQVEEGAARIERADHDVGRELGTIGQGHAGRPAVIGQHPVDRRLEPDLGAEGLGGTRQDLGEPAVAALVEGPRAELAVVLAERVEEQDQARALRARADLGADDPRRRQVSLEQIGLEIVVEEVRGAPGQQPHGVVKRSLVEATEPRAERGHPQQLLRIVAEGVGRDVSSSGLITWQTRARSWLYCS